MDEFEKFSDLSLGKSSNLLFPLEVFSSHSVIVYYYS